MKAKPPAKSASRPAAPAVHAKGRPHLRVLGTEITLLEGVRRQAEEDLGISISFELLDFPGTQQKAARQPDAFDIYDQCFHNLDIVWFWRGVQPIDTERIRYWDEVSDLTKRGRLNPDASIGHGDAPVNRLYVQPDETLGAEPSRHISMLPTVHNFDSFAYDPDFLDGEDGEGESWAWLLDERWAGKAAIVDEPAIGIFDAALAAQARREMSFVDMGNMSLKEIDGLVDLLIAKSRKGHFCGIWRTAAQSVELMKNGRAAIQSIWSPASTALTSKGVRFVEASPREGYRAWHGGMCLSARLSGRMLDVAYEYLNWWLSGWAGAVMTRQGYYMSVFERARAHLSADEWGYWYEGRPARSDLPGPDGRVAVRSGQVRNGGSYWRRASRIAVWNTTMDEHNYLVRRWNQFVAT
jgi:putative spermidine/putrescine transport system substrate-binding protein